MEKYEGEKWGELNLYGARELFSKEVTFKLRLER